MTGFILRAVIAAFGLWLASAWVDGFSITTTPTLLIAAALLGVVNATIRPIAIVLTFPITIVTLGIFLLVINAGMLGLVAWALPDFSIAGFWSALLGAIIVSIVSWIGTWFVGSSLKVDAIRR
ncbi:MAG TPA: phage holin family protein [Steroidobacteraceae bacterium]|jgi:putative membrane protein|nr:phage holin family protein [Steroidobacteraceae bacterium]HNS28849.1 phage holin family protein [Steroidobacteraceae bacterium]